MFCSYVIGALASGVDSWVSHREGAMLAQGRLDMTSQWASASEKKYQIGAADY